MNAGIDVTILARGRSSTPPEGVQFLHANRSIPGADDAMDGKFDVIIELAYEPARVHVALDALAQRAQHWTLISSISALPHNGWQVEPKATRWLPRRIFVKIRRLKPTPSIAAGLHSGNG